MPKRNFIGKVVLITSGGTREPIDPVRFITNSSSGKMGLALAEVVHSRGGKVIFITASQSLSPHQGLWYGDKVILVNTAREMFKEVKRHFLKAGIIIMAAAVADFRPEEIRKKKIKKEENPELSLKLIKNPDIIAWLGKRKGSRILVGFCAETENLRHRAVKKLKEKNADLMVGVNLRQRGGCLGKNSVQVELVEKNGKIYPLPRQSKKALARLILDKLSESYAKN